MCCHGLQLKNDTCYFFRSRFEGCVDGRGVFCSKGQLLILLPQLFVHEGQGVIARGQALNFELAVRPRVRVVRFFTTLTNILIHGCWLHFTGSITSSRAKLFSRAAAFGAWDSFHSRLSLGVGLMLCVVGSSLTILMV